MKVLIKRSYVQLMRILGFIFSSIGVLRWLERRQDNRIFHWFRSLFAIYDLDQMIALDVPWWTYDAIDAVDAFLTDHPDATVFEYGSGASTVWLAKRAGTVASVEHDEAWYLLMQSRIGALKNAKITHVPADPDLSQDPLYHAQKEGYAGQSFEAYAKEIMAKAKRYDVIVIDGRARVACLETAKHFLAPDGIIVFDNTKRQRYQRAITESALNEQPLPGLTPSLPYPDKTTLLTAKDI
ncbi:methyltransferase family protein [Yoonia maricola]|uniref:Methyltransferase family protein n=1 Tax=Yoonia maricola TaxID=420999 RepID=A0A2M8WNQ8_9RHOB|nr:class I SAM-dependent methyltransferase [Yoonia maricola]PJI92516.1 methyltransferase family protein [Yoonia maricola]